MPWKRTLYCALAAHGFGLATMLTALWFYTESLSLYWQMDAELAEGSKQTVLVLVIFCYFWVLFSTLAGLATYWDFGRKDSK